MFRAWYRSVAERIAAPLAAAIRACGGRPQTPAAKALVERRIDSASAVKRAQAAARVDSLRALRARIPGPGRWVVDSTLPRKNRRQTWWAAVAANDTLVGRYEAMRPVLQLYCASDRKRIELVVLLGQPADPVVNTEKRHGSHYFVTRAAIVLGRDDQPVRYDGWLYDSKHYKVGPEEGKQLDQAVEDVSSVRRYRFGVRLLDMKQASYTVFDLDRVAEQLAWLRQRCGVKPA